MDIESLDITNNTPVTNESIVSAGKGSIEGDTEIKLMTSTYDQVRDLKIVRPVCRSILVPEEIHGLWLELSI